MRALVYAVCFNSPSSDRFSALPSRPTADLGSLLPSRILLFDLGSRLASSAELLVYWCLLTILLRPIVSS